jgi:hypothetical protein
MADSRLNDYRSNLRRDKFCLDIELADVDSLF